LNDTEALVNARDDTGARSVEQGDCFRSERARHGYVMQDIIRQGMSDQRALIADQRVA
jgi:hypothetical protein